MELDETALIDVRGKQLEHALRQTRTEVFGGVVAILLAVFVTSAVFPLPLIVGWATLTAACYGGRYWLTELQRRAPADDSTLALRLKFLLMSVASTGLCWGVGAAFVIWTQGLAAATPFLLLACATTTGALVARAGVASAVPIEVALTLLPPLAVLVAKLTSLEFATALGVAAIGAATLYAQRLFKGQLWEASALRERNKNLAAYLDQRRVQVEKLSIELKTNQSKREQAEIDLRRTAADLGLAQGKAKALADTLDRISPLCQVTGLANRRHFDQLMDSEWRRAGRDAKLISLCVVDIDDFDEYLSAYGRQSADALLKRIATTLKGFGRRAGDTAGRYEQTKLALLLPGCDARHGGRLAEALRKRVESQNIPHANAKNGEIVTVHIAVAMIKPTRTMQPIELLKRVDTALYEARFQGGNRLVIFQPLTKLKVERWDIQRDGPFNEQSLLQKLLVWGYDTTKLLMRPGTVAEPEIMAAEKVLAISSGELKIEVEGHSMTVKPGDCVFIPQGVEMGLAVAGERQVVKFTARKNK